MPDHMETQKKEDYSDLNSAYGKAHQDGYDADYTSEVLKRSSHEDGYSDYDVYDFVSDRRSTHEDGYDYESEIARLSKTTVRADLNFEFDGIASEVRTSHDDGYDVYELERTSVLHGDDYETELRSTDSQHDGHNDAREM